MRLSGWMADIDALANSDCRGKQNGEHEESSALWSQFQHDGPLPGTE